MLCADEPGSGEKSGSGVSNRRGVHCQFKRQADIVLLGELLLSAQTAAMRRDEVSPRLARQNVDLDGSE